jgi:hypothetical protein
LNDVNIPVAEVWQSGFGVKNRQDGWREDTARKPFALLSS